MIDKGSPWYMVLNLPRNPRFIGICNESSALQEAFQFCLHQIHNRPKTFMIINKENRNLPKIMYTWNTVTYRLSL